MLGSCQPPHCSAIAWAIPVYVLDLSLLLPLPIQCIRLRSLIGNFIISLYTLFVDMSFGRFFSHRQVLFVSGCPYSYGFIVWSAFRIWLLITLNGFYKHIFSIGAAINIFTNSSASSLRYIGFFPSVNHLAPDTLRCVHGG
jgi:hypothetical protein